MPKDITLQAVDESLRSVNLFEKNVADKIVGHYSGGMKRRLSVAISTIGNPAHSMEEAEALCDRVGIFVDGYLQSLGSPVELKARFGGYFELTVTTPSNQEEEVEKFVQQLSPTATKVYHLSGTQKFHKRGDCQMQQWRMSSSKLSMRHNPYAIIISLTDDGRRQMLTKTDLAKDLTEQQSDLKRLH